MTIYVPLKITGAYHRLYMCDYLNTAALSASKVQLCFYNTSKINFNEIKYTLSIIIILFSLKKAMRFNIKVILIAKFRFGRIAKFRLTSGSTYNFNFMRLEIVNPLLI